MKIMLVCAGGMSTGILMNKMGKWAKERALELEVKAYGVGDYEQYYKDYQCILLGPQISYKEKEIKKIVGDMPVAQIASMDYALGNVDNIMKQVDQLGVK